MNRLAATSYLLFFGLGWGATVPLTQIAVGTGHHPLGLIFWQMILSALLLWPIARWRGSRLIFDRRHIFFYSVVALVGTVLPNTFSYWAAFHLPGGVMALSIATVPIFTLVIAIGLGSERPEWRRTLGVLCGVAAVALITLPDTALPDPAKALFVLIALIAPFFYGVEGNYLASPGVPQSGPIATLFGASIIGIVITAPLTLVTGTLINPFETLGAAELALVASIGLHVFAYLGYIWLVSEVGAVFTSQISYIVTPAGVVLSVLFLNESPSAWLWLALVLILVALALVQPRRPRFRRNVNR